MSAPAFRPRPGQTYDSLRRSFRYDIPPRFNLGSACCDPHDRARTALVTVAEDGAVVRTSFGELSDLTSGLAAGLAGSGIARGDRVGVVVPQSLATGVAHLAVWKLGAVSIPLAGLFGPDALGFRLRDAGAVAVIATPENRAKVEEAVPEARVIEVGPEFDALCRSNPLPVVDTAAEDPAFLIYTSGTTGSPKGALHAHRTLFGHLPAFELYYEFAPQPDDVIWTPADWAWIGGLMDVLIPAWYHGMTVLTDQADFDPHRAVAVMRAHGVTLAFLPPTALKMMRAAGVDGAGLRLRAIFSGGEALGEEMLGWAQHTLGCHINEGYGQTEANIVVGNCASVWPVRPGSMGRPIPGHDVQVQDDDGNRLVGEVGEIVVGSPDPVMMLGYWNRPEATAEKFRDGWLLTGDLGREDDDGYLWFESRKDDVISSMGYRIGPGEIEESLMGHPAVAMCAVVGIPDEVRGQVPAAFVVVRDGFEPGDELVSDLQRHVRTRLAAHEVPRRIEFLDELPRTTTGKILRRTLRDRIV
ncbi:MAG TPA: AMP-binding protein [Acidimicrobiia bacterium]|nr:AMP-binding protein [Acidimicrobiia bacterium]